MRKPDSQRRPPALFVRDLAPPPRPPEVQRSAQVTTMMVGEETDVPDTQR
ncbi:hypothetical protein [Pyxidicoccus xibeiensis]|nr:hypothetical protein [Pyxidicoccus xibeiensis]MCP3136733.1 hypothetical protein [Pyxidicoccus xibeiensis]